MLGTEQLEAMRAAQLRLLGEPAVWSTVTYAGDGMGGRSATYTAQDEPVPARIGPPTGAERALFADRFKGWPGWVVTVPHDALVADGDHLTVMGRTYEVVGDLTEGESILTARRLAVVGA